MKYILVTGANGGLGRKIVQYLKDEYTIFSCDLNKCEKEENIIPINMDITNDEQIENTKKIVQSYTKTLYAIINVAGIFMINSLLDGKEEDLRKIIEVNFYGAYKINKAFFPLLEKNVSKIINLTSEIGRYEIAPFNAYYGLSKHLLDNYSDCLRREYTYLGIKVVKIQAGSFKTTLLNEATYGIDSLIEETSYYKKELTRLKRLATNELTKQHNPEKMGKLIKKIVKKKKPKACYKINNSLALSFLDFLPSGLQDFAYKKFI